MDPTAKQRIPAVLEPFLALAKRYRARRQLSSANIQIDTTQRFHADELRAIRYCGKRLFMMQATEDRFHEDERIRRQAMAGF
jgi:hypothetical protein